MQIIKKQRSAHQVWFENEKGEPIKKVCYECKEALPVEKFEKGKGLIKLENNCKQCTYNLLYKGATENPRIRVKEIDFLAELIAENPNTKFCPKYDSKGRRWLFFTEKDDFRQIALDRGWKAAREKYDVNQFVYGLLRRELFTPDEIKAIDKITPKQPRKKQPPYKDYELTVVGHEYNRESTKCTWLIDDAGRKYLISNRFRVLTEKGVKLRFTAKVKGNYQRDGEKYTQLFRVKNDSIEVIKH